MITVCCMCKKVLSGSIGIGHDAGRDDRVSHGYCPECYQRLMKQLRADSIQRGPSYKRMMCRSGI